MSDLASPPDVSSLPFVEDLYLDYLKDAASVPETWRRYFEAFPGNGLAARGTLEPSFERSSLFNPPAGRTASTNEATSTTNAEAAALQQRADRLVRNYRVRGHIAADLDPLGRPKEAPPELEPAYYDFTDADMASEILSSNFTNARTLSDVIDSLKNTYTRSIGAQFMHIDDLEVRKWLQERMERTENRLELSRNEQVRILTKLTDAVIFEEFIQKKFIGAKSFSLEGSESLIPCSTWQLKRRVRRASKKSCSAWRTGAV